MSLTLSDRLAIVYGADSAVQGGVLAGSAPVAVVMATQPLRLNAAGFSLPTPGSITARGSVRDLLLDHLMQVSGPWDTAAHQFSRRYFDYLDRQIVRNRHQIEARLSRFRGLYVPEDTLFSAPAPLPRALLQLPDGEDAVPVDFAFWLGSEATAALSAPSRLSPKRSRARLSRLEAAGVGIVTFTTLATPEEDDQMFDRLLGTRHAEFFSAEPLPCGPTDSGFWSDFVDCLDAGNAVVQPSPPTNEPSR